MRPRASLIIVTSIVFGLLAVAVACADCVTLKSGGELRGEILADPKSLEKARSITIRTLTGATVIVERENIAEVVRRRPLLEEYETRRRTAADTVAGQWELAEWCRQKSLPKEREVHLRRVVGFDAGHVAAHRALGHIRIAEGWGTPNELKAARGLVKHKGKFVSAGHLDAALDEERASDAERDWSKKVKLWHGWLTGQRGELKTRGESELKGIRDADAVPALARVLRNEAAEEHRLLFVNVLSQIEGNRPIPPLAVQSLHDESENVRATALFNVREKDASQAVAVYVRALKSPTNVIVNRAGAALGFLGQESALSPLIDALVTRHEYSVEVPNPEPFICTEGQSSTANVVLPPAVALKFLSSGMMPLLAQNMPQPIPGQEPEKEMMTVTYQQDEENAEVLAALTGLTEQTYGFDKQAWRKWYNTHKRASTRAKKSKP